MFRKIIHKMNELRYKELTKEKELIQFHEWMNQKSIVINEALDKVAKEKKLEAIEIIKRAKIRKKELKNDK